MSFQWSITDLIAGASLCYKLIQVLSGTQYQAQELRDAIMTLEDFKEAFMKVGKMATNRNINDATVNAAKYIVISSISSIEKFFEKTKKYQERLGGKDRHDMLSRSWQKVGWSLFKKEELQHFKESLEKRLLDVTLLLNSAKDHEKPSARLTNSDNTDPVLTNLDHRIAEVSANSSNGLSYQQEVLQIAWDNRQRHAEKVDSDTGTLLSAAASQRLAVRNPASEYKGVSHMKQNTLEDTSSIFQRQNYWATHATTKAIDPKYSLTTDTALSLQNYGNSSLTLEQYLASYSTNIIPYSNVELQSGLSPTSSITLQPLICTQVQALPSELPADSGSEETHKIQPTYSVPATDSSPVVDLRPPGEQALQCSQGRRSERTLKDLHQLTVLDTCQEMFQCIPLDTDPQKFRAIYPAMFNAVYPMVMQRHYPRSFEGDFRVLYQLAWDEAYKNTYDLLCWAIDPLPNEKSGTTERRREFQRRIKWTMSEAFKYDDNLALDVVSG